MCLFNRVSQLCADRSFSILLYFFFHVRRRCWRPSRWAAVLDLTKNTIICQKCAALFVVVMKCDWSLVLRKTKTNGCKRALDGISRSSGRSESAFGSFVITVYFCQENVVFSVKLKTIQFCSSLSQPIACGSKQKERRGRFGSKTSWSTHFTLYIRIVYSVMDILALFLASTQPSNHCERGLCAVDMRPASSFCFFFLHSRARKKAQQRLEL